MKASSNKRARGIIGRIVLCIILFLLLLLTFSYHWTTREFGSIGFAEIVFTLNMPLQGTSPTFIRSFLLQALLPAAGIILGIILVSFGIVWILRKIPGVRWVL